MDVRRNFNGGGAEGSIVVEPWERNGILVLILPLDQGLHYLALRRLLTFARRYICREGSAGNVAEEMAAIQEPNGILV
jgi:hypothetical protein